MDNWAEIARRAAIELLGEQTFQSEGSLRWGTNGSLWMNTATGGWYDHESEEGGGIIELVIREGAAANREEAVAWLHGKGLEGLDKAHKPPATNEAKTQGERVAMAGRIWRCAKAMRDDDPGWRYLVGRRVWPSARGAGGIPGCVRWLDSEDAPARNEAGKWYGLPKGAAGGIVFRWTPRSGETRAVTVMAIDAGSVRIGWGLAQAKIRATGPRRGTVVLMRQRRSHTMHVAEGEMDGLAIASAIAQDEDGVIAVAGSGGMRRAAQLTDARHVVLHVDGDAAGRRSAQRAREEIEADERTVTVRAYEEGEDAANYVEAWMKQHGEGQWDKLRTEAREGGE